MLKIIIQHGTVKLITEYRKRIKHILYSIVTVFHFIQSCSYTGLIHDLILFCACTGINNIIGMSITNVDNTHNNVHVYTVLSTSKYKSMDETSIEMSNLKKKAPNI